MIAIQSMAVVAAFSMFGLLVKKNFEEKREKEK
jgi:hypothetical protein